MHSHKKNLNYIEKIKIVDFCIKLNVVSNKGILYMAVLFFSNLIYRISIIPPLSYIEHFMSW